MNHSPDVLRIHARFGGGGKGSGPSGWVIHTGARRLLVPAAGPRTLYTALPMGQLTSITKLSKFVHILLVYIALVVSVSISRIVQ